MSFLCLSTVSVNLLLPLTQVLLWYWLIWPLGRKSLCNQCLSFVESLLLQVLLCTFCYHYVISLSNIPILFCKFFFLFGISTNCHLGLDINESTSSFMVNSHLIDSSTCTLLHKSLVHLFNQQNAVKWRRISLWWPDRSIRYSEFSDKSILIHFWGYIFLIFWGYGFLNFTNIHL